MNRKRRGAPDDDGSLDAHLDGDATALVAARKELLVKEKELTRLRDRLAAERQALPWDRLLDLFPSIHHQGPVLYDGLTKEATREEER